MRVAHGRLAVPFAWIATAALLGAAGCTAPGGAPSPRVVELTVFGAASLRDVLADLERAYEDARPAVAVTVATDSSTALRVQIEQGAPADVFLSADVTQPQVLARAGRSEPPVPFAGNALAIVVPVDNPAGLRTPADLANHGVRIVAAGEQVPISVYADQLIGQLAALDGYPSWFFQGYEVNVVSREDDVRAVLAKVELGEADAGIVYATDARRADGVRPIPIPPGAGVTAVYAAVALDGPRRPEAEAFLDWLTAPDGEAILARFGFLPAP